MKISLKQKIHAHCLELLNSKIKELEKILNDLSESAANDTKSSAGDKHETARAMIHIEQETITKQLNDVREQKASLEKIEIAPTFSQIVNGSLVETNKGYLFLSTALGKIDLGGIKVMVISPKSPLGLKLLGLRLKNSTTINEVTYIVEHIF